MFKSAYAFNDKLFIPFLVTIFVFFIIDVQDTGYEFVPMMLFGIGGLLAGSLLWLLPETKDQPTLQTIEEAAQFYKKHFDRFRKH